MFYAIDTTLNERIYIDDVINNSKSNDKKIDWRYTHKFFCPKCDSQVIVKSGDLITDHFAHKSRKNCDKWHSEMTPWHKSWQDYFVKDLGIEQEKIIINNGTKHIADIFIPSKNLVIEFQHSLISLKEMIARTDFYSENSNLIWVFDWIDKEIEFTETNRSFEYYFGVGELGRKLRALYEYVHSANFKNNTSVKFFFDLGDNTILELRHIWKGKRVYFREHRYSYFKHNLTLCKNYNGFSDYLANEDIK